MHNSSKIIWHPELGQYMWKWRRESARNIKEVETTGLGSRKLWAGKGLKMFAEFLALSSDGE